MLSNELWDKINKLSGEDTMRLRLAHHGDESMSVVIDQIECRQRTKKKLAEMHNKAPRFFFPTVLSSEQATSDQLAAYHASLVESGAQVLDMTCGLGIDAFHIASKASKVLAADINTHVAEAAAYNACELGLSNFEAIGGDSVELLSQMPDNSFDLIFIDPARRGDYGKRQFALSDCEPDVTRLIDKMLAVAPKVIIKASPMLDIRNVIAQLPNVKEIMSVGTRRECKELVIVCRRGFKGDVLISAVTVDECSFSFSETEERGATPVYEMPVDGDILLECYPATVKAGPFKLLSSRFEVNKIAPNTHLYSSKEFPADFPGRGMIVKEVLPFDKNSRKALAGKYGAMDITARNFPLQPSELAKRLKLKSGGKFRLFAVRDKDDKCRLIVTEPLD